MRIFILLLSFITANAEAQTIINNQVIIGTADSLHSNILNEQQSFWISLPTSYFNSRFAKSRYPVVYLFDGDANFSTVSAITRQLSVRNGNSVLPEVIVVGIMNNNRSRDFTPYPSSFWVYNTPSPLENTGGGERFVEYLQKELMPHIDSLYPTAPYRVLIGHSLGGLATANIFINHTSLFNAYIIIDPSLWFDNQRFLGQAKEILGKKKFDGVSLYLGMANNLPPNMDTLQLLNDTTKANMHMRSIFQFKNALLANSNNGLRFKYGYYDDDTHMSVPLITEYNGLRFIFNFFHLPPSTESMFFDINDHTDPAQVLKLHFQHVSQYLGYQLLPPESLTNIFANTMKNYYLPMKALSLYQLNIANYPSSYGALESLGEFYADEKDKVKAIEYYQKALKIKDDKQIREKLSKLLQPN